MRALQGLQRDSVTKIIILIEKIIDSVIQKKPKFICQPTSKKRALRLDIRIILLYSARKKRAKPIAEYSTL